MGNTHFWLIWDPGHLGNWFDHLSNVFISQCSLWTNGKLIFPFVQVMRRVMTNGKLVYKGLVQGTTFACHNDFNEGHDMALKLCMKHQNLVEAACGCRWCCAKGPTLVLTPSFAKFSGGKCLNWQHCCQQYKETNVITYRCK